MAEIVLTTLNARYIHASLGLRYLRANLGPFRERSVLREFTTKRQAHEIAAEILSLKPKVVGFGVYIWNTRQTLDVVRELRAAGAEFLIVLGGPEISFEWEEQELFAQADFVFKGEADLSFRHFIENFLLRGEKPTTKMIMAPVPDLAALALPYGEFSDADLAHRVLYVEASRGCPYKCQYCLSALDQGVRGFDLERLLLDFELLLERGARRFKFVDRTFNLSPTISTRILEFFLKRVELGLFLHFEVVPDRLPDGLKRLIEAFPPGSLQFEIGIQTWNPQVARNVSRRQDYTKIEENLRYLRAKTGVHTHADLIVGLPGETWASFAAGFNQLYALEPDEIQVGLLKRLKGTPITALSEKFQMRYASEPPFSILSTQDLSTAEVEQLRIFAEFWDLVANSGRFAGLREAVATSSDSPFEFYHQLAGALYLHFERTHSIHLRELADEVLAFLAKRGLGHMVSVVQNQANSLLPPRQSRHTDVKDVRFSGQLDSGIFTT